MISTLIFDLDGVLIDAKPAHFKALNDALPVEWRISEEEHATVYDGLTTIDKLKKLTAEKGLPETLHAEIVAGKKQNLDLYLNSLQIDPAKIALFTCLQKEGLKIYVASNSIRYTVETALKKLGIDIFVRGFFSNEDVTKPKPNPEIYLKAMIAGGVGPDECLIVEDSPVGLEAAYRSGAHVLRVDDQNDLSFEKIMKAVGKRVPFDVPWEDPRLNILVPMAGSGKRFSDAGYTTPKPLIPVKGKPMIQVALDSLKLKGNFIFLIREQDVAACAFLNVAYPGCRIIPVTAPTEGAASTTLLASDFVNNNDPLLIVNSDQYIEYDAVRFMYAAKQSDASILTFAATEDKWSYAQVANGLVVRVAEKQPISTHATVGVYYWKKGSDYVKYANQMIDKNIRVNGEFYVCPVFNEALCDQKKVTIFPVKKMLGMGTPEDLEKSLLHFEVVDSPLAV